MRQVTLQLSASEAIRLSHRLSGHARSVETATVENPDTNITFSNENGFRDTSGRQVDLRFKIVGDKP